ncbi:cell division protein FtsQ/DivIB [Timonella sp. A28]|uniref:cell division protein FtsQ/DivIB n=1 Tax=Timonella sp. A28 TaxID=3442640 RepID=UPI003EBA3E75
MAPSKEQRPPSSAQPTSTPRKRISSQSSDGKKRPEQRSASSAIEPTTRAGKTVAGRPSTNKSKIAVLSTGVADRLAEREAIERKTRRGKRVIIASVVLGLATVVWLFGFSSIFSLDLAEVRVSGAQEYVQAEEVVQALEQDAGTPLSRLDMGELHDKVAAIPNVKSATQTRRWPRGVSVTVVERAPVAAVSRDKKYVLLDIDAVEVAVVKKAPEGLPIMKIPLTADNQRTLVTALEVLDALPSDLLADIASITASSQDNIVFTLRNGIAVQWGNSAQTILKIEVLRALMPTALEEQKSTIDLSAPTFPIIR